MNMFKYIREERMRNQSDRNDSKASKLKNLRRERIRLEGQVRIDEAYNKEKLRIREAKVSKFQNSNIGRLAKGIKNYTVKVNTKAKLEKKPEINEAFSIDKGKKKKFFYE